MTNAQKIHKKHNYGSEIIFALSITVSIITLISVVFPSLILGVFEDVPKYPQDTDIFEKGVLFYPFFIVNIIAIFLTIIYLKNKVPQKINSISQKIKKFDISRKQALVIVLIILDFYIVFTFEEVWMSDVWEDYNRTVKPKLETFTVDNIFTHDGNTVSILLGKTSMILFGSYRIIPLFSSAMVLFLTYYFTTKITGKQISGIISMSIVISSTVFLTYDTTITYPNFWIMFYLLSLIVIHKWWPLSPILFIITIMSKPLPILFLPMTFFFIYSSKISKKKKYLTSISYMASIVGLGTLYFSNKGIDLVITYNNHEFWSGFTTVSNQFRFEPLIILFLIPVLIWLFIQSKKENKNTMWIIFLITWMLLLAPIISGFTTYTNNTHRFIPLIIFFAIAIGILFSTQIMGRSTVQRTEAVSPG